MPAPTDVEVDPDTALVGQQLNISLEDITITADANLSIKWFCLRNSSRYHNIRCLYTCKCYWTKIKY
jgi:hypothetical protein